MSQATPSCSSREQLACFLFVTHDAKLPASSPKLRKVRFSVCSGDWSRKSSEKFLRRLLTGTWTCVRVPTPTPNGDILLVLSPPSVLPLVLPFPLNPLDLFYCTPMSVSSASVSASYRSGCFCKFRRGHHNSWNWTCYPRLWATGDLTLVFCKNKYSKLLRNLSSPLTSLLKKLSFMFKAKVIKLSF